MHLDEGEEVTEDQADEKNERKEKVFKSGSKQVWGQQCLVPSKTRTFSKQTFQPGIPTCFGSFFRQMILNTLNNYPRRLEWGWIETSFSYSQQAHESTGSKHFVWVLTTFICVTNSYSSHSYSSRAELLLAIDLLFKCRRELRHNHKSCTNCIQRHSLNSKL